MALPTRRRAPLRLFTVVVEDARREVVDRVLLDAAPTMDAAEQMARAFYAIDADALVDRGFAAQPITEVSGPGGDLYRIVLRRMPVRS